MNVYLIRDVAKEGIREVQATLKGKWANEFARPDGKYIEIETDLGTVSLVWRPDGEIEPRGEIVVDGVTYGPGEYAFTWHGAIEAAQAVLRKEREGLLDQIERLSRYSGLLISDPHIALHHNRYSAWGEYRR